MAIDTFTWRSTASQNKQVKFSVLAAQFDDGYEQVADSGISPIARTWSVSVTGTEAIIGQVEEFLDKHTAATSFYWVAPRIGQILVRATADGYSVAEAGGGTATLSVTFKQVPAI